MKCAVCVLLCGNKIAGDAVPDIVIALKRNGAYADRHPSAATWIDASCLKVERIVALKDKSNQARRS